jgi:thiol:disulfide interchange protein DsbD
MKNLILVTLILISTLFANDDFLEPEQAFIASHKINGDNVSLSVKIAKEMYLYDKYLKVKADGVDITKDLVTPKPVKYDEFIVHFGQVTIDVPKSKIKEKVTIHFQGCSKKGLCYPPMTHTATITKDEQPKIQENVSQKTEEVENKPSNETDLIAQTMKDGNVLLILSTFFGFGLLLSLTPCIFPMVPILSSIIVQQSAKEKDNKLTPAKGFMLSLVYVVSMGLAYSIAGVLAGMFGANIQAMLQNPFVIVAFAGVFVALAFSMFGYFEIGLPASWQTKLNKASDEGSKKGGFVGVAIMGFLSALIVGPCVAPPLAGALMYIGQTGDAILGGIALFVMSIGMGIPLLLIGAGSGKFIPKAGGWMTTVSKVFGVIMLGVAIWMLDKIIPTTATFGLFILLFVGSAIYLFKSKTKIGNIFGILSIIVAIVIGYFLATQKDSKDGLKFEYIKTVAQLEEVVKNSKKPIMIDYWATWCVSCKELDNITFKDEKVLEELSKYRLLKVDVTNNTKDDQALMKKFNIFGPPALVFYKNGVEEKNKRIIGYKNPEEFLKIVK